MSPSNQQDDYQIRFQAAARRAISHRLPEAVAAAAMEFCAGPLHANPQRVGKPLSGAFAGAHAARRGSYRVIYRIDEKARMVQVLDIAHRQDAYRPR